jgi:hypothetical protein
MASTMGSEQDAVKGDLERVADEPDADYGTMNLLPTR